MKRSPHVRPCGEQGTDISSYHPPNHYSHPAVVLQRQVLRPIEGQVAESGSGPACWIPSLCVCEHQNAPADGPQESGCYPSSCLLLSASRTPRPRGHPSSSPSIPLNCAIHSQASGLRWRIHRPATAVTAHHHLLPGPLQKLPVCVK